MSPDAPRRRGPYSKGIAKRQAILDSALELYAASPGPRPTLKAIASAVSLSEAGVLHYFGGLDELLVAVLEARDAQAADRFRLADLDHAVAYLTATTQEPGLTRLFVEMTVAAGTPGHPAGPFLDRHRRQAEEIARGLLGPGADPGTATLLVAGVEGLQLRWLADPAVDVPGAVRALVLRLREPGAGSA